MNIFKLIWPDFPNLGIIEFDIARPVDAEEIALLAKDLVEVGMPGWAWNPDHVDERIHNEQTLAIVGRDKAEIATCGVIEFGHFSAHLDLLLVKPKFQHKGVGRGLLGFLEKVAELRESASVTLEVREDNLIARRFYLSQGYREIGVALDYYRDNQSAIRMTRHPGIPFSRSGREKT